MIRSLLIFFLFLPLCVFGQLSVGVGASYGISLEDIGVQVQGRYKLNNRFRPALNFIYYIDSFGSITETEFNANLHYILSDKDKINFYTLIGINTFRAKVDDVLGIRRLNDFGFNLGGGLDLQLSDKISGTLEAKYDFSKNLNQWVISIGIMKTF